jgi:hypothetical protein
MTAARRIPGRRKSEVRGDDADDGARGEDGGFILLCAVRPPGGRRLAKLLKAGSSSC